ncbi:MAG: glycosyltransferase [Patescibacteria group bacterium]|nr:glycosyltransferase [Patescibacteria group bacterium]MDE2227287.1 glycosyltransferase [Patescibacteria group bacterium]
MANFMSPICDIVIPTYDNEGVLFGCLSTLLQYTMTPYRLYLVNNGSRDISGMIRSGLAEVHNTGKNLGWQGGVNYGVKKGKSKYVLFMNDDTQILDHYSGWLNTMINIMEKDSSVGAVVPMSNCVMHMQNMMIQGLPQRFEVGLISGFCVLTRRDIFERIGGLDENLSGGDDIDFSIRIRDAGYKLIVARDVFVFHRGYTTGSRIFGDYWNSSAYKSKLDHELIRKHGFKKWCNTVTSKMLDVYVGQRQEDFETLAIYGFLDKTKKILDIGCGSRKIIPEAIGLDVVPRGTTSYSPAQINFKSQADINADFDTLPVGDGAFDIVHARHVLEHAIDPLKTLKEWKRVLKPDGTMVLALPDEEVTPGIPLDPTHLHAFTKDSAKTLIDALGGMEVIYNETPKACYSFVIAARRVA